ncbi:MAG: S8 family serine peptidase [Saprospiraceae bacterium]|nr:S8 family serine peptidase [Saprospiraceae bacterium]
MKNRRARWWCCFFYACLQLQPQEANAQTPELSVPGHNLFVNRIAAQQNRQPAFDGRGIVLSIKEFRFDSNDVDLRGRTTFSPNAAANLTTHANIMATLAGGAGNTDLSGRGAAPGCSLISSSFVGLQPDPDYADRQISVQNHSYGVDIQSWYGERAATYDQTTARYPPLLHVFSAGNKGTLSADTGVYAGIQGFANITGEFKMAKNALVAGATDSFGNVWSLSSRGPAGDGRIKPDLVAFGQDGTSGAAALVSGAAAVLQQTLYELDDTLPRADLVRAVLLAGADDIAPPGPDFHSGFGSLNLKNAVDICLKRQYRCAGINTGQSLSFPLVLPAPMHRVRITLAWNDPPAVTYSQKTLLNDLQLRLYDPAGNEYRPLVLNTAPHPDSLALPARPGQDSLNNLEQVYLEFPTTGTWEIKVSAGQLQGSQSFALAWSEAGSDNFEWIYPLQNDPCPAGESVLLRWENTLSDSLTQLLWKPADATEWQFVADSVDLQKGWRRWRVPDTFTVAQLRIQAGSRTFDSEPFLIAKRLRMELGFDCPDSVMLYWNALHPAANYQLYGLGERYMEPLLTVTDTLVVLPKNQFRQERFAVSAVFGGIRGARSPAPDIHNQGIACFFRHFFAVPHPAGGADLVLELGTFYGLTSIQWEKWQAGTFIPLLEEIADRNAFSYRDEQLLPGANTYRVRLRRSDGQLVYSEPATLYDAGPANWFVFPNPAPVNGALQVLTRTEEDAMFRLSNLLGQTVLEQVLPGEQIFISLEDLAAGVYVYAIEANGQTLGKGKLVIH